MMLGMGERAARWAAPAAVAVLVVVGAGQSIGQGHQNRAAVAIAAVVAIALTPALRATGLRLPAAAVVIAVSVAVICDASASNLGWFALCVLAGTCALEAGAATAVPFTAGVLGLLVAQWVALSDEPGWLNWLAGTVFTTVVCLMARRQLDLVERLRQAQAGLVDRARAEERLRISRELHDVVAHALTVSLLHLGSARLAVQDDPGEAEAALEQAEQLSRAGLAEVRQAVGLLRDQGSAGVVPLPDAAALPQLIEGFRRAGVTISYEVSGDPGILTATAGLTVYRILQEALTNAARHAAGSPVRVRLEVATLTRLLVDSTTGPRPRAEPPAATGPGHGLRSMSERAEALGGRTDAGPSPSGWRVRAEFPTELVARPG